MILLENEYVSKFESLDILYNRPYLKKNQAYPLHSFTIQGNEKPMLIHCIPLFFLWPDFMRVFVFRRLKFDENCTRQKEKAGRQTESRC